MTINTLDDLLNDSKFYYYYTKNDKIDNKIYSFFLGGAFKLRGAFKDDEIIKYILDNGNGVYEWWIELDPQVIEEVNREFDLSK